MTAPQPDSPYAAMRLVVALALMTIGNAGMYIVVVVLPAVQAEFGVARAEASLPYALLMIGMGVGGVLMGRLADRFGVMVPLLVGSASIGLGYAGYRTLWRKLEQVIPGVEETDPHRIMLQRLPTPGPIHERIERRIIDMGNLIVDRFW